MNLAGLRRLVTDKTRAIVFRCQKATWPQLSTRSKVFGRAVRSRSGISRRNRLNGRCNGKLYCGPEHRQFQNAAAKGNAPRQAQDTASIARERSGGASRCGAACPGHDDSSTIGGHFVLMTKKCLLCVVDAYPPLVPAKQCGPSSVVLDGPILFRRAVPRGELTEVNKRKC